MNNLSIFENNEFGVKIRTITSEHGEPLFIAKDIADALGYTDSQAMTRRMDEDEKVSQSWTADLSVQARMTSFVTESGLYNAIIGSQKPEAKAFKRWITHDVLPAIRKTGKYAPEPLDRETKIRTQYQNWMQIEADTLKILGFDLGWMRADAIERAHHIAQKTGIDVLPKNLITNKNAKEIQWTFNPDVQLEYGRGVAVGANYINVTKWAEEFELVTSKHINVILERLGLQVKLMPKSGIYRPTESGKLYAGTATISGKAKNAGKLKVTGWNVSDQRFLDLVIPEIEYLQQQLLEE